MRCWRLTLIRDEAHVLIDLFLLAGESWRSHGATIVGHLLAVDELAVLGLLEDSGRFRHVEVVGAGACKVTSVWSGLLLGLLLAHRSLHGLVWAYLYIVHLLAVLDALILKQLVRRLASELTFAF